MLNLKIVKYVALLIISIFIISCSGNQKSIPAKTDAKNSSEALEIDKWSRHHIADLPNKAMYILADDLNGDGLKDIVSGAWWWENPGTLDGVWKQYDIGEPLRNMAILQDVDDDGDIDIIGTEGVGAEKNRQFVWAKNDGKGAFSIMSNIDSCASGDFLQGVASLEMNDEKYIVLSWHISSEGNYLLHIPKNPSDNQWTMQLLSSTTQNEDVSVGDIDRDGDNDLLLGTVWQEKSAGKWIDHTIGSVTDFEKKAEPDRVKLADIDGDGRLDAVVSLERGKLVYWFKAPQDPTQKWQRNSIGFVDGQGFSMDICDFDMDGDIDVVVGEHKGKIVKRVFIFQNFDNGRTWNRILVDSDLRENIDHHDGTVAVDMDSDGDADIISIG